MSSLASPGGSSALRTRCTRRSDEVTVPSVSGPRSSRREDDVGHLGGPRQEDVLDHDEIQVGEQLPGPTDVRLGLGRILADHVEGA